MLSVITRRHVDRVCTAEEQEEDERDALGEENFGCGARAVLDVELVLKFLNLMT